MISKLIWSDKQNYQKRLYLALILIIYLYKLSTYIWIWLYYANITQYWYE